MAPVLTGKVRFRPLHAVALAMMFGLFFGDAADGQTWGPEERVTNNATMAETGLNHGALAVDSWGRVTAAWAEQDGPRSNFQIYTAERSVVGTWTLPELAVTFNASYAGNALGAKFPALLTMDSDSLLMVWHDYRLDGIQHLELYGKIRAAGLAWGDSTSEERITNSMHPETNGDNSYVPNLVRLPNGEASLAWHDFRFDGDNAEILTKDRVGGTWDTAAGDGPDTNVSLNSGDSHFVSSAATNDGSLHLAWRDNTDGSYRIYYRRRTPTGTWTNDTILSPPAVAADGVTLAAAGDGRLIAVWSDVRTGGKALYSRERSAAGVWAGPERITSDSDGAEEASVVIDANLRVHVVWQDARVSVFNRELFYQSKDLGTAWDSTGVSDTQLSFGSGKSSRPTLLADEGSGRLFLLWQDARHGATEIYFREALSQTSSAPTPSARQFLPSPNPFYSSTQIFAADANQVAGIYDLGGRRVRNLSTDGQRLVWDGNDNLGRSVAAGTYLVRFRAQNEWVSREVVKLP